MDVWLAVCLHSGRMVAYLYSGHMEACLYSGHRLTCLYSDRENRVSMVVGQGGVWTVGVG